MNKSMIEFLSKSSMRVANSLEAQNFAITPQVYIKIFSEFCEEEGLDIESVCDDMDLEKAFNQSVAKIHKVAMEVKEEVKNLKTLTDKTKIAIKNRNGKDIEELEDEIIELSNRVNLLESKIYLDNLTKAFNREWFLEKKLDENYNFIDDGFIVLLNIDELKDINKKYGFEIGDKVLIFLVEELKEHGVYQVVRLGGSEFLLFFDEEYKEAVANFMKKFKNILSQKSFYAKGKMFHISFAFGITEFKNGDFSQIKLDELDELIVEDEKH